MKYCYLVRGSDALPLYGIFDSVTETATKTKETTYKKLLIINCLLQNMSQSITDNNKGILFVVFLFQL